MGKIALITGGTAGIGKSCAYTLAAEGFDLILLARRKEKLEEIKEDIEKKYQNKVMIYEQDVRDYAGLETIATEITMPIDVLVNNAGLALGVESFQESNWDELETMIQTNILGMTKVTHCFIDQVIQAKGHVVNISSISGTMPYPGGHAYGGTKSYVNQFSSNLRIDLLGTGVRVTDIAPGKTNTEFSVVRFKGDQERADNEYIGFRALQAEDITRAILFSITQPAHVNIDYMVVNCTDWARPGFAHVQK